MKWIIVLLIMGILLSLLFVNGCIEQLIDPCEAELQDCNHRCGEGILSSICKEKCTWNYNQCRENS